MKIALLLACLALTSCAPLTSFIVANESLIEETLVYGTRQAVRAGTAGLKTAAKNPVNVQP